MRKFRFVKKIKNFFRKKPLHAKGVSFSYDGSKNVLQGFNLTVRHNQIVGVVGQSGEGKSTFLHLLSGSITKGYGGKIKIHGVSAGLSKKDIGFVPQEISLLPDLSIKDNLRFFGSLNGISGKRAENKGLELMDLLRLNFSLGRKPSQLSGGQKSRFNIIVSLLHEPKVLILDEPFVGLDYKNRKVLWHFLEYLKNRKHSVILTTHMLVEAEMYSDRIVLLKNGKVFASGKLDDLREKLNAPYIVELKIRNHSKTRREALEEYCKDHDISIMDDFNNYMMFAVDSRGTRNYLYRFMKKQGYDYKEMGFREPNLDELFLKVKAR